MRWSADTLIATCRALPAVLIAYYSGDYERPDGSYGTLCVFSRAGRRAVDVPYRVSGNSVDLYALRWLLRQPAPRLIVTDGEFCGGPSGQDVQALVLLQQAVMSGAVRWVKTADEIRGAL